MGTGNFYHDVIPIPMFSTVHLCVLWVLQWRQGLSEVAWLNSCLRRVVSSVGNACVFHARGTWVKPSISQSSLSFTIQRTLFHLADQKRSDNWAKVPFKRRQTILGGRGVTNCDVVRY